MVERTGGYRDLEGPSLVNSGESGHTLRPESNTPTCRSIVETESHPSPITYGQNVKKPLCKQGFCKYTHNLLLTTHHVGTESEDPPSVLVMSQDRSLQCVTEDQDPYRVETVSSGVVPRLPRTKEVVEGERVRVGTSVIGTLRQTNLTHFVKT